MAHPSRSGPPWSPRTLQLTAPPPLIPAVPETRRDARAFRIARACFLLVSALLLCLLALKTDPVLDARFRRLVQSPPAPSVGWTEWTRKDPPAGTALPSTKPGQDLRKAAATAPGPAPRGYLVVDVGDCTHCMQTDLAAWELSARQHRLRLLLVTSSPPAAVAGFRQRFSLSDTPIARDPERLLAGALNTMRGRPYLFARDWRLRWVQHSGSTLHYNPFLAQDLLEALKGLDG